MSAANFEACLADTLKWEGGYSNNAADPGGPTMRGVIQREYDAWRKKNGKRTQFVRKISEDELRAIYRDEYWNALGCDDLPSGLDLCVFDAGVNSGVAKAKQWLTFNRDVDAFCDARMTFLRRLGRTWRVFGPGWTRRVAGIRHDAHVMAGVTPSTLPEHDGSLHAGMIGDAVTALQTKLRALGYPCGLVDGIYGEQTYRAVILFQHDNELQGEPGVWLPSFDAVLETAQPMLPKRNEVTAKDLDRQGDGPVKRLGFLQRMFAWLFGAGAIGQAANSTNLLDTLTATKDAFEPLQGVAEWAMSNKWILIMVAAVALISFIRYMLAKHVENFQSFAYQGGSDAVDNR